MAARSTHPTADQRQRSGPFRVCCDRRDRANMARPRSRVARGHGRNPLPTRGHATDDSAGRPTSDLGRTRRFDGAGNRCLDARPRLGLTNRNCARCCWTSPCGHQSQPQWSRQHPRHRRAIAAPCLLAVCTIAGDHLCRCKRPDAQSVPAPVGPSSRAHGRSCATRHRHRLPSRAAIQSSRYPRQSSASPGRSRTRTPRRRTRTTPGQPVEGAFHRPFPSKRHRVRRMGPSIRRNARHRCRARSRARHVHFCCTRPCNARNDSV